MPQLLFGCDCDHVPCLHTDTHSLRATCLNRCDLREGYTIPFPLFESNEGELAIAINYESPSDGLASVGLGSLSLFNFTRTDDGSGRGHSDEEGKSPDFNRLCPLKP